MRIAISGSSGFIGTHLRRSLTARGDEVIAMVRSGTPSGAAISWDPRNARLDPDDLRSVDVVVNLAGPGIADHRWTESYRRELVEARVAATTLIADTLAELAAAGEGPKALISASAIGWYGDRGDEKLDESSDPGVGFLPDLCQRWEAATGSAADAGVRVATLRTGTVLGDDGGALPKLLRLFRLGVGGRLGGGKQWMSWISIDDEIGAIQFLIDGDAAGPFNLTAPEPVQNSEFTTTLASVLRRPAVLPVPAFAPRVLLGRQLADALLFDSARIYPAALEQHGYQFQHRDLRAALEHVIGT